MRLSAALPLYHEAFIRLLYPEHCYGCGSVVGLSEKILCRGCAKKMTSCERGLAQAASLETFENLDEAWSLFQYESLVKSLLTRVKFSNRKRILEVFRPHVSQFGRLLAQESFYDAVIPIPISKERLLTRQFNQSEILAQFLSRETKLRVKTDLLKRKSDRPSQSRLGREERLANSYRMFHVSRFHSLRGKRFLIIDDVLTTGATAEDAARALKERHAKQVDLLTLAYTE